MVEQKVLNDLFSAFQDAILNRNPEIVVPMATAHMGALGASGAGACPVGLSRPGASEGSADAYTNI